MMTIEITTLVLIGALALILSLYHHKQAASLRAIEQAAQDYYALQFRSIRRNYAGSLDSLDAFEWVSRHVSEGLSSPLAVTDVIRVVPEMQAVDLRAGDNRRVVISARPWRELYFFDRRARQAGQDRLASFASRPLLNRSRFGWGVRTVQGMTSNTDEFFDLEAEVIGRRFGVSWSAPTRLFFYVVE